MRLIEQSCSRDRVKKHMNGLVICRHVHKIVLANCDYSDLEDSTVQYCRGKGDTLSTSVLVWCSTAKRVKRNTPAKHNMRLMESSRRAYMSEVRVNRQVHVYVAVLKQRSSQPKAWPLQYRVTGHQSTLILKVTFC